MYKKLTIVITLIVALIALSACNKVEDKTEKLAAEYNVKGQSEHWKASLEYIMRENNKIWVEGKVEYINDEPPEIIDIEFIIYDIVPTSYFDGDEYTESIAVTTQGRKVIEGKIEIEESFNRRYDLEVYEEAINYGYIEIKWKEKDKEMIEKINTKITN